ncbi:MAG: hypothetical protein ABIF77_05580 [bacterium]
MTDVKKDFDYECVEPELGALLWQYDLSETGSDLRRRLDNHLVVCDACRLSRSVGENVASGLRAGSLHLPPAIVQPLPRQRTDRTVGRTTDRTDERPAAARTPLGIVGGLALAASLALILWLPPLPVDHDLISRDDPGAAHFLRPVEGEVILDKTPTLSWTPIAGATRYRVTVQDPDGTFHWQGTTKETELTVPGASAAPDQARFRAVLEPIPADLAQPEGISVSFRTGDLRAYLGFRLGTAHAWVLWLGLIGGGLLAATGWLNLRRRSAPA